MYTRYSVLKELGRGAQARIFLVHDRQRGIDVVLKKYPIAGGVEARVKQEFKTLSQLSHPQLPIVYDFGVDQSTQYFYWTTEYIAGTPLDGLQGLNYQEVLHALVQLLHCLDFIHEQGFLHLDIKPANIFLTQDQQVKLLDFGLSCLISNGTSPQCGGTAAYASPEQLLSQGVDARSDLYSAGITAYELFTRHHPFLAEQTDDPYLALLTAHPRPPSAWAPHLPEALDGILLQLIARDRGERPVRARNVIQAINEWHRPSFPLQGEQGVRGAQRTLVIKSQQPELNTLMQQLIPLHLQSGPHTIGLNGFRGERLHTLLQQIYYQGQLEGWTIYCIDADDDWVRVTLRAAGQEAHAQREGSQRQALHLLNEAGRVEPIVFLFAEAPDDLEVLRSGSDNRQHALILIYPISAHETCDITIDASPPPPAPDALTVWQSRASAQKRAITTLALCPNGLGLEQLKLVMDCPTPALITALKPSLSRGEIHYHDGRFCLIDPTMRELSLASLEPHQTQHHLTKLLALKLKPLERAGLLLRTGSRPGALPFIEQALNEAFQEHRYHDIKECVQWLGTYPLSEQNLSLLIRAHIFLGNYQQALISIEKLIELHPPKPLLQEAKRRHGWLLYKQGRRDRALVRYQEALELAEQLDNKAEMASLANEIAYLVFKSGDKQAALAIYDDYQHLFAGVEDPFILSNWRYDTVLASNGRIEAAWKIFRQKESKLSSSKLPQIKINSLLSQGYLYQLEAKSAEAFDCYQKAQLLCEQHNIYGPKEGIMQNLKKLKLPTDSSALDTQNPSEPPLSRPRIFEILEDINSETDLNQLLEKLVDYALDLTGGLRAFLLLKKPGQAGLPEYEIRITRNFSLDETARPPISYTFLKKVFKLGRPLITVDAAKDEDLKAMQSVLRFELHSIMCVPIKIKNKNLGALYIDHPAEVGLFQETHLEDLDTLGRQAAIAIDRAALMDQLRQSELNLRAKLDESVDLLGKQERQLERAEKRLAELSDSPLLSLNEEALIGQSPNIVLIRQKLQKIKGTRLSVHIQGERGTGKRHLARHLHQLLANRDGPDVFVDCQALAPVEPSTVFFGDRHDSAKTGLLVQASGGSLILHHVQTLPVKFQKELSRVLQNNQLDHSPHPLNLCLISTSTEDLNVLVAQRRFREELYYQLVATKLVLDPLRERMEDMAPLVNYFMQKYALKENLPEAPTLKRGAIRRLIEHKWPGNVRELEQVILNACHLSEKGLIRTEDLEFALREFQDAHHRQAILTVSFDEDKTWEDYELELMNLLVKKFGNNRSLASTKLDVSRSTLIKKLKQANS